MKITEYRPTIAELIADYYDDDEEGVYAYGGKLNVRPKYQREFVYDDAKQKAVIDSILNGFPLNAMYWADNGDGTYEVIDGQQRTLSICRFAEMDYSIEMDGVRMNLSNIKRIHPEMYDAFMNYHLQVYICEGKTDERLKWFERINIQGELLTAQELRNVNYTGSWLTAAKKYFSKTNCAAQTLAAQYLKGDCNRQEVLETVLRWITNTEDCGKKTDMTAVCEYMAAHQDAADASELIDYFERVIDWVKELFPNYRKEMKGQDWGIMYNKYHENEYDPDELEEELSELENAEDVTKTWMYGYVLSKEDYQDKAITRKFSAAIKKAKYTEQSGHCAICGEWFPLAKMEADHIIPFSKGGRTILSNCQCLCKQCNRDKSSAMEEEE